MTFLIASSLSLFLALRSKYYLQHTCNICPSLDVVIQVSHAHVVTGKFAALYNTKRSELNSPKPISSLFVHDHNLYLTMSFPFQTYHYSTDFITCVYVVVTMTTSAVYACPLNGAGRCIGNILDLYSGDIWFKSQPEH